MDRIILDNIAFEINFDTIARKLHIDLDGEDAEKLKEYIDTALKIGRPKVLYRPAYVESKGEDFVIIDGIKFKSHILSVNLENIYRVFLFTATCGRVLQDWTNTIPDVFERYWADTICETTLDAARKAFDKDIKERFDLLHTSKMNPGSLQDWPISEQQKLFQLLGDTDSLVGVKLTDTCLMIPAKSVSGILFPTEATFESCQLCQRDHCPRRKAPYDSSLYDKKYSK